MFDQNCFEASIAIFASMVTGNYTYCSCNDGIYTLCSRNDKTTELIRPWMGHHLCFHRKGKSLSKNFALLAFRSLEKNGKMFPFLQNFALIYFAKNWKFRKKWNAKIFEEQKIANKIRKCWAFRAENSTSIFGAITKFKKKLFYLV